MSLGRGPQRGSAPRLWDAGAQGLHLWGTDGVHALHGGRYWWKGSPRCFGDGCIAKLPGPPRQGDAAQPGPRVSARASPGVTQGPEHRHCVTRYQPQQPLPGHGCVPTQAGQEGPLFIISTTAMVSGLRALLFSLLFYFFFFSFPPLWKTIFECLDHAGVSGAVYSEQG